MIELLQTMVVSYTLHGMLGGVLYVVVSKFGWDDKEEILRRLAMGAIGGYLVLIAGLPDSITAVTAGYVGIDVIESMLNKFRSSGTAKII